MESRGSTRSLVPGFRFHPTDEELVRYYLRRKISGRPFKSDPISEIDIYKVEPWDLPGMSRLKTRDLEWYFFSFLDKKYGNGASTNRATEKGYWKTTGKDMAINSKSQVVGMKKILVYHRGRAPKGQRTNWVMHEYRLIDEELNGAGIPLDAFVLCRVFQKSGALHSVNHLHYVNHLQPEIQANHIPTGQSNQVLFTSSIDINQPFQNYSPPTDSPTTTESNSMSLSFSLQHSDSYPSDVGAILNLYHSDSDRTNNTLSTDTSSADTSKSASAN